MHPVLRWNLPRGRKNVFDDILKNLWDKSVGSMFKKNG